MLAPSKARENRQAQARHEKQSRENRRGTRQHIGLAAPGHEATAAANTKRAALGALEQDDRDKRDHDHKVYDDQNRLHRSENPHQRQSPRSGRRTVQQNRSHCQAKLDAGAKAREARGSKAAAPVF
jgi:hypothetical protein